MRFHEPYIISEIGLNHNGSIEEAYKLIEESKKANCNAVKFQIRSEACLKADPKNMEIGQQYVYQYILSTFLNFNQYEKLIEFARNLKIDVIVSCWDIDSLLFAHKNKIKTLKIASADLTNLLMIETAFEYFDNFIMSTGMSNQKEIITSVSYFLENRKNLCLLHCQSAYPSPVDTLNLKYIKKLKKLFPKVQLGYSGHELEYYVCLSALSYGAIVFEKHLTLNKNAKGNDHVVSLYPDQMRDLCKMLKEAHKSLGNDNDRIIQPGEKANRISLGKSLTVNKILKKGTILKKEYLDFTYGGKGLSPDKYKSIINKKLINKKNPGEIIELSDISGYKTIFKYCKKPIPNCKFGIPVRYHDAPILFDEIKPDFLEFHLSHKDIDYPFNKIKNLLKDIPKNLNNTFHAPDFYSNDLIFDPFSKKENIRKESIFEFEKFLNHIIRVNDLLGNKKETKVKVITSFSSATLKEFLNDKEKDDIYKELEELIKNFRIKYPTLEILPQTLPVNAWYLGGRRLVNIFADPREILNFCKKTKLKICLDSAHTIMSSNYYSLNPNYWINELLQFTDHIHLVDAKGDSDEGLLFGEGDLDLKLIVSSMKKKGGISFIPEIWQGHHNLGEGFKIALNTINELKIK